MHLIISAFPGCGKSTIFKCAESYNLIRCNVYKNEQGEVEVDVPDLEPGDVPIYDSDSSNFPKEGFPQNYIDHIKDILVRHDHVVIMVSSHQAVREAMSLAGIQYRLVYPKRELKEEFIQRYKDRGSPEVFVTMMEEKWDTFIDSCDTDGTFDGWKFELGAGQGIVDVLGDAIAAVVDKVKKALTKVLIKNSVMERIYSSSGLKELLANAKQDTATLTSFMANKNTEHAGMESAELFQNHLDTTKQYAKETYGVEVEASIAGVESFMEQLRTVLKKAKDMLKHQPDKQGMMQIKRSITDSSKAIKLYGSESWLSNQTFKDVSEITINTVPAGLDKVRTIDELGRIVNPYVTEAERIAVSLEKEARAKLVPGLKIWNQFKGKTGESTQIAGEIQKALDNVKLPLEKGFDKYKFGESFNGPSAKGVRVPPLDKAGVVTAVKILDDLLNQWFNVCNRSLDVAEDALSWDDLYDNDALSEISDTNRDVIDELMNLVEWETLIEPMGDLELSFEKHMVPIAQMLENWILYSVE